MTFDDKQIKDNIDFLKLGIGAIEKTELSLKSLLTDDTLKVTFSQAEQFRTLLSRINEALRYFEAYETGLKEVE